MFQKDMQVSLLLDFYGEILPERRRELTGLYYNDDLSLSEIAEITGISRQGVRDAVKRSVDELHGLEDKLGLAARFGSLHSEIDSIVADILILSENTASDGDALKQIAERLSKLNI